MSVTFATRLVCQIHRHNITRVVLLFALMSVIYKVHSVRGWIIYDGCVPGWVIVLNSKAL